MMKLINISKELLMQADFLNTVGGGMSMAAVNVNRNEDGYRIEVKSPGVSVENMRIEILNQNLMVYYGVPVFGSEAFAEEDEMAVRAIPYILASFPIPGDADVENISARYENGKVIIIAPFNNMSQGYQRTIEIEY